MPILDQAIGSAAHGDLGCDEIPGLRRTHNSRDLFHALTIDDEIVSARIENNASRFRNAISSDDSHLRVWGHGQIVQKTSGRAFGAALSVRTALAQTENDEERTWRSSAH